MKDMRRLRATASPDVYSRDVYAAKCASAEARFNELIDAFAEKFTRLPF